MFSKYMRFTSPTCISNSILVVNGSSTSIVRHCDSRVVTCNINRLFIAFLIRVKVTFRRVVPGILKIR